MQATGNNQNQSYSLSICLKADGFSFYGYNPAMAEPIAIESHTYNKEEPATETLKKALQASSIIQKNNHALVYGLVDSPAMQVPLEYFRKEDANAFYRLTYTREKYGKTYYNILPHLEIAQIFAIDLEIEQVLSQYFPNIKFYHSHAMMLEKISLLERKDKPRLYVYFHEQDIFIFHYQDQRLKYANTFFSGTTADNAVYFILSVWKNLGLDMQNGECMLIGESEIKQSAAQYLSKYLHHVKNTATTDIYRRSPLARNPQVPFDLLTLLSNVI